MSKIDVAECVKMASINASGHTGIVGNAFELINEYVESLKSENDTLKKELSQRVHEQKRAERALSIASTALANELYNDGEARHSEQLRAEFLAQAEMELFTNKA